MTIWKRILTTNLLCVITSLIFFTAPAIHAAENQLADRSAGGNCFAGGNNGSSCSSNSDCCFQTCITVTDPDGTILQRCNGVAFPK